MRFNQPIQSGNSRNINVKKPAFFAFCYPVSHNHRVRTRCLQQRRHGCPSLGVRCQPRGPCPARGRAACGVPLAAVSHVRAAPAPRAQRHAQPRLPGLVVLVEVQPKAQEPKALVRAGCQQDQELLDDSLKGKEKPKRQLRKCPSCALHRNIRWCTDLVNRQRIWEKASTRVHIQQNESRLTDLLTFYKNSELFYFSNICHACQSLQHKQLDL